MKKAHRTPTTNRKCTSKNLLRLEWASLGYLGLKGVCCFKQYSILTSVTF